MGEPARTPSVRPLEVSDLPGLHPPLGSRGHQQILGREVPERPRPKHNLQTRIDPGRKRT